MAVVSQLDHSRILVAMFDKQPSLVSELLSTTR